MIVVSVVSVVNIIADAFSCIDRRVGWVGGLRVGVSVSVDAIADILSFFFFL